LFSLFAEFMASYRQCQRDNLRLQEIEERRRRSMKLHGEKLARSATMGPAGLQGMAIGGGGSAINLATSSPLMAVASVLGLGGGNMTPTNANLLASSPQMGPAMLPISAISGEFPSAEQDLIIGTPPSEGLAAALLAPLRRANKKLGAKSKESKRRTTSSTNATDIGDDEGDDDGKEESNDIDETVGEDATTISSSTSDATTTSTDASSGSEVMAAAAKKERKLKKKKDTVGSSDVIPAKKVKRKVNTVTL
jgi:hypothetical protein